MVVPRNMATKLSWVKGVKLMKCIMSIATFTTPLKGSPCTCIASGTNSINVKACDRSKEIC
jgi:hypothetical protein